MSSSPPEIMVTIAPDDIEPHLFFDLMSKESDRGLILVITSHLDEMLLKILKSYLLPSRNKDVDIFSGHGALATFSSRIDMTYRLGIIDKSMADAIDGLRKSRNKMAHKIQGNFNDAPHVDFLNGVVSKIKKSHLLNAMYEVHHEVMKKITKPLLNVPSLKGEARHLLDLNRQNLTISHLLLSTLLGFIVMLLDGNVDKSEVSVTLENFDEDHKRLSAHFAAIRNKDGEDS